MDPRFAVVPSQESRTIIQRAETKMAESDGYIVYEY
jgi:hypothetical protein